MSTQYVKNYYCDSSQDTSSYPDIIINLQTAVTAQNYISAEVYNEMIEALKSIHDFGESDDVTRKPYLTNLINSNNNLIFKSDNQIIQLDYYQNIASSLENQNEHSQYDIIYGSYFEDLKTAIENYKVPSTRYYTTTTSCCDCHGECCVSQCCVSECCVSECCVYSCMCISCDDYHCGGAQMGRGG